MYSRVLMFVIGAVYIYYQVLATEDVYIAELMVESNVTLEAQTVLSFLNMLRDLQVTGGSGLSHTVTFLQNELIAECLNIGEVSNCSCSSGYVWSNEVCYTSNCCNENNCMKNVSHITPLCIAKVKVYINGNVKLSTAATWDDHKTTQLEAAFRGLNGFQNLTITGYRQSKSIADFEAATSVKFSTSKLQEIVTQLETSLTAVVMVNTLGMVTIDSPGTKVCYQSTPQLKCTFEEATGSAGWSMSRENNNYNKLYDGTVVQLDNSCTTKKYKSCVALTLKKVTGIWAGIYECGFIKGSVNHTAKTKLSVALLPDVITMKIDPPTADCSKTTHVNIKVTATIPKSTETFEVSCSILGGKPSKLSHTSSEDNLVYAVKAPVMCQKMTKAQYVKFTFKNTKGQKKSAQVDIPVIYDGEKFCSEEEINGELWPKTPAGDTVIIQTCGKDRAGYKSRTCEDTTWQPVFSSCIKHKLKTILNSAENFREGLGATPKLAMDIFEGLKNSSTFDSDSSDNMADINASIAILSVMASASKNIALKEEVFPNFVDAASNIVNNTWDGVNSSTVQNMSSNYLQSLEGLVKNIRVKNTSTIKSQNLDLNFCSKRDCNVSIFDISVSLNGTPGIMKTFAVKNLMDKLRNNFKKTVPTGLLISATLEDNSESLEITLDFPNEQLNPTKPFCVFWSTMDRGWSDAGCTVNTSDSNHTLCKCNHLTAFSVLMAKSDISSYALDIITDVGLGLSICSLLIFLIIESLVWSAVVKTSLSHFRHTAMVNIAVFLLLAQCSFLASTSREILTDTWCLVLTICKHLFFLSMFGWMLCMSAMLVHQLIFVFNPLRKRVFMFLSSIVGYVCPILIVGSSYVYCKYTNKHYHDRKTCWLVFERVLEGSIHAFILPVGVVTLTNLFSMMVVILTLTKTSAPDGSKSDERETAKSILKVVVFLTPVFGVTWAIGFILLILDNDHPMFTAANYSFTIFNSFQGLFILVTGCFAEQKVREELVKLIMAKSKGRSGIKNLTSTTYTKDK